MHNPHSQKIVQVEHYPPHGTGASILLYLVGGTRLLDQPSSTLVWQTPHTCVWEYHGMITIEQEQAIRAFVAACDEFAKSGLAHGMAVFYVSPEAADMAAAVAEELGYGEEE